MSLHLASRTNSAGGTRDEAIYDGMEPAKVMQVTKVLILLVAARCLRQARYQFTARTPSRANRGSTSAQK